MLSTSNRAPFLFPVQRPKALHCPVLNIIHFVSTVVTQIAIETIGGRTNARNPR
jgi:hypothetical protein